jgi:heterogeneous nuclear rnp K-like protein 2
MATDESSTGIMSANQDVNDLTQNFSRLGTSDSQNADVDHIPRSDEEYAAEQITLRAIVSSKEAGVIIGKAGKNVADLRDETGVRAGVSKVVPGVHDRVLTVQGSLTGISKAYRMVAKGLLDGAPQIGMGGIINTNGTHGRF